MWSSNHILDIIIWNTCHHVISDSTQSSLSVKILRSWDWRREPNSVNACIESRAEPTAFTISTFALTLPLENELNIWLDESARFRGSYIVVDRCNNARENRTTRQKKRFRTKRTRKRRHFCLRRWRCWESGHAAGCGTWRTRWSSKPEIAKLKKLTKFCKKKLQIFGGLVLGCIKTKFC